MARKGREISGRDGEHESEEWLENVRETDDGSLNIVAVDEQTFARTRIVPDRHPANAGSLFALVWRVAEPPGRQSNCNLRVNDDRVHRPHQPVRSRPIRL